MQLSSGSHNLCLKTAVHKGARIRIREQSGVWLQLTGRERESPSPKAVIGIEMPERIPNARASPKTVGDNASRGWPDHYPTSNRCRGAAYCFDDRIAVQTLLLHSAGSFDMP